MNVSLVNHVMKGAFGLLPRGNCYAASEALYHILGGKRAGWTAYRINREVMYGVFGVGDTHWFLRHKSGIVLDPSMRQFPDVKRIPYHRGIAAGFLTRQPSRKAKALIAQLTWQEA